MTMTTRLDWNGLAVTAEMRAGAAHGLGLGSEHVLGEARKVVPIAQDGGTLERSGVASVDADDLTAAVSFDTPYAVVQHEELDYRHAPGRTAKYLETPMAAERAVVGELVAASIRRGLS